MRRKYTMDYVLMLFCMAFVMMLPALPYKAAFVFLMALMITLMGLGKNRERHYGSRD